MSEPQPGTPLYLQQAYDLTALSATQGSAVTVAVIDAYNDPTAASDLATYRAAYGLPACTTGNGCFQVLNETGASSPLPANSSSWSVEESLDIDAVSALCPNCKIDLVEANQPSSNDMQNAIQAAVSAGATFVSNSWSAESPDSPFSSSFSFPGVSVLAASGDEGTLETGENDYPAALSTVTAVGGTTLNTSATTRGYTESAWNDGGSGCDTNEAAPSWQSQTGCAGRAYSDLAADGDPSTGLNVYDSEDGGWIVVGGTSLATPLVAAYEAVTGVNGTTPQWAYSDAALLNDVTSGSDGGCAIALICNAASGWDGPTGVGTISGDVVTGAPGVAGPDVNGAGGNTYALSVGSSSATLTGGIYPNGEGTTYYWQYGRTTSYGSQTNPETLPAGTVLSSVQGTMTGLAPATVYHYRLVASNASGTTYGYDFTLTTAGKSVVDKPAKKRTAAKPVRGKVRKHRRRPRPGRRHTARKRHTASKHHTARKRQTASKRHTARKRHTASKHHTAS